MRLAWLFVIGAAACSDSSAAGGDAASSDGHPIDAPPPIDAAPILGVRARVGSLVVGATSTTEAIDPTKLTVLLADGSSPAITMTPDGTISFQRITATQGYAIAIGSTVIDADAQSLTFMPALFGHEHLTPVTLATPVTADVTPAAGGGSGSGSFAVMFATGQRAGVALPSPSFQASADWRDARGPDDASPGLLSASQGDTLWFLHYASPSAGHVVVDQTVSMSVEQTDGSATDVTGTATALATAGCVRAAGPVSEELARLVSAIPGATGATATFGVATQRLASTVGDGELAVGTAAVAADSSVDIPYTTPFTGEDVIGTFEIDAQALHAVGNMKITTPVTMKVHVLLGSGSHGCTDAARIAIPAGAAFATGVSVGGVPVAADEQPITPAGGAMLAVLVTASSGSADRYTIDLVDQTASTTLGRWVSARPSFTIPRASFTAGHTYSFTMRIDSGLAGAAQGDLTSVTYPISSTTAASYTFTVSP